MVSTRRKTITISPPNAPELTKTILVFLHPQLEEICCFLRHFEKKSPNCSAKLYFFFRGKTWRNKKQGKLGRVRGDTIFQSIHTLVMKKKKKWCPALEMTAKKVNNIYIFKKKTIKKKNLKKKFKKSQQYIYIQLPTTPLITAHRSILHEYFHKLNTQEIMKRKTFYRWY